MMSRNSHYQMPICLEMIFFIPVTEIKMTVSDIMIKQNMKINY